MPIVNGNYVADTLPGRREAQEQAFGSYQGRNDMADYSSAAYNYLMKQQEQAYNLELWHLMNEYNSPAAQMKRYQDAGLSPWLIYGQSNEASAPASASAPSFRSAGTMSRGIQNGISAIGQIMNTVKAARETYDYMKYGARESGFRMLGAQAAAEGQNLKNEWDRYLLGYEGYEDKYGSSPRATMYRYQMQTQEQRFEQLKAIIKTIPDQNERTQALTALDQYRLKILQGQNDAILNINTGNSTLDGFLRILGYWLISK